MLPQILVNILYTWDYYGSYLNNMSTYELQLIVLYYFCQSLNKEFYWLPMQQKQLLSTDHTNLKTTYILFFFHLKLLLFLLIIYLEVMKKLPSPFQLLQFYPLSTMFSWLVFSMFIASILSIRPVWAIRSVWAVLINR